MEEKKRFKKQTLNEEDHRGIENGARVVKHVFSSTIGAVAVYRNREKLIALAQTAVNGLKKLKR